MGTHLLVEREAHNLDARGLSRPRATYEARYVWVESERLPLQEDVTDDQSLNDGSRLNRCLVCWSNTNIRIQKRLTESADCNAVHLHVAMTASNALDAVALTLVGPAVRSLHTGDAARILPISTSQEVRNHVRVVDLERGQRVRRVDFRSASAGRRHGQESFRCRDVRRNRDAPFGDHGTRDVVDSVGRDLL